MRYLFLILTLFVLAAPATALAQSATSTTGAVVKLQDPLDLKGGIPELVGNIVNAAVGIVGAMALLIFVYGGFLLLTSAGEAGKIQSGKDAMKWSVIGLAVVFSSYALVRFVLSTLTK